MAITAQEKLYLRKLVKELKTYRAPHTEFVTVYIPADYELTKITQHLGEEQGTASNIKSAGTRKNVQGALEKMIQHLRNFPRTPPNGLAVFAGNVAAGEGKQDFRIWSMEPPVPLKTRIYRCDKLFVTEILEEMISEHNVYGLVVLDKRDAILALLRGKTIVPVQKTHSEVPGKFKAGGQCLGKDSSIILADGSKKNLESIKIGDLLLSYDFKNKIFIPSPCTAVWNVSKTEKEVLWINTEHSSITASLDHLFFVKTVKEIKEVPASALKENDILFQLNKNNIISTRIKLICHGSHRYPHKKVDLIDISVKNQNFIANGVIVHNSAQRFARLREGALKEHFKKIAEYIKDQFLPLGNNLKGIIIGGPGITVTDFLNYDYITGDLKKKIIGTKDLSYTEEFGLQELLDKSEDLLAEEEVAMEKKIMNRFFEEFRDNAKKITYGEVETRKALEMNVVNILLLSEALPEEKIIELSDKAAVGGSEVKLISVETREGQQLKELGGIAAILRFAIE